MEKLIELMKKYKSVISYAFFGVCTTAINIASYFLLYEIIGVNNVVSTIIAWGAANIFAFITNKIFVFESRSFAVKLLFKELLSFLLCRIFTGILDVAIMYVSVDVMKLDPALWKIISNILVIIINYIASKLIIFRKKQK